MENSIAVHHSVLKHLESLSEVLALLRQAKLMVRTGKTAEVAVPALNALCGWLEDIRLDAQAAPDARHRGVVLVFYAEAEGMLLRDWGTQHRYLRRAPQGDWRIRAGRLQAIAAPELAAQLERLTERELQPFLQDWLRPIRAHLAG